MSNSNKSIITSELSMAELKDYADLYVTLITASQQRSSALCKFINSQGMKNGALSDPPDSSESSFAQSLVAMVMDQYQVTYNQLQQDMAVYHQIQIYLEGKIREMPQQKAVGSNVNMNLYQTPPTKQKKTRRCRIPPSRSPEKPYLYMIHDVHTPTKPSQSPPPITPEKQSPLFVNKHQTKTTFN